MRQTDAWQHAAPAGSAFMFVEAAEASEWLTAAGRAALLRQPAASYLLSLTQRLRLNAAQEGGRRFLHTQLRSAAKRDPPGCTRGPSPTHSRLRPSRSKCHRAHTPAPAWACLFFSLSSPPPCRRALCSRALTMTLPKPVSLLVTSTPTPMGRGGTVTTVGHLLPRVRICPRVCASCEVQPDRSLLRMLRPRSRSS